MGVSMNTLKVVRLVGKEVIPGPFNEDITVYNVEAVGEYTPSFDISRFLHENEFVALDTQRDERYRELWQPRDFDSLREWMNMERVPLECIDTFDLILSVMEDTPSLCFQFTFASL